MKVNTSQKVNLYPQGQQWAAILWLLASCCLGGVLAAPDGQQVEAGLGSSNLSTTVMPASTGQGTEKGNVKDIVAGLLSGNSEVTLEQLQQAASSLTLSREQQQEIYNMLYQQFQGFWLLFIKGRALISVEICAILVIKYEDFFKILQEAMKHSDKAVYQAAIKVFGKFLVADAIPENVLKEAIKALQKAMGHPNKDVCQAAIEVFGKLLVAGLRPEDVLKKAGEALQKAMNHQDEHVCQAAIEIFGKLLVAGPIPEDVLKKAGEALQKAMEHPNKAVCQAAIDVFGKLLVAGPIPKVVALLVKRFGAKNPERVLPVLERATDHKNVEVYKAAVRSLADFAKLDANNGALEIVVTIALKGELADVWKEAVDALQKLPSIGENVLEIFTEAINSKKNDVSCRAFAVLATLPNLDNNLSAQIFWQAPTENDE